MDLTPQPSFPPLARCFLLKYGGFATGSELKGLSLTVGGPGRESGLPAGCLEMIKKVGQSGRADGFVRHAAGALVPVLSLAEVQQHQWQAAGSRQGEESSWRKDQ